MSGRMFITLWKTAANSLWTTFDLVDPKWCSFTFEFLCFEKCRDLVSQMTKSFASFVTIRNTMHPGRKLDIRMQNVRYMILPPSILLIYIIVNFIYISFNYTKIIRPNHTTNVKPGSSEGSCTSKGSEKFSSCKIFIRTTRVARQTIAGRISPFIDFFKVWEHTNLDLNLATLCYSPLTFGKLFKKSYSLQ